ncbi:MAG: T9SS type A sorting domain-containing protein [Bacteroidia bacterium]
MKTKLCITIILLTLYFSVYEKANAQSPNWLWAKSIGGTGDDLGSSIAIDVSGNVYTTGYFEGTVDFDPDLLGNFNLTSAGGSDIFISKLDGSGNFVWAVAMGGIDYDDGTSIITDASGNVYTIGYFEGTVDFDPGVGIFNLTSVSGTVFVSKLDSSGNFVWAKAMGGTSSAYCSSIVLDTAVSGNIYITGLFFWTVDFDPGAGIFNLTAAGASGYSDIFISKLDSSGNFLWAKRMGGAGGSNDAGQSIALDPSGNGDVYTTGYFIGTVDFDPGPATFNLSGSGCFISKLDASSNFVWAKAMGGSSGNYIALDPAGSGAVYTTGNFNGSVDFDPGTGVFNLTSAGNADIFISKLDNSGNFVWAKKMGGTNSDVGYSIALDLAVSGDVYTTGTFEGTADFDPNAGVFNLTSAGYRDIFISKLDSSGNFVWAKRIGGTSFDDVLSIALDASGNVHVSGSFSSPSITFGSNFLTNADNTGNTADIFIVKLDALTGIESVENNNNGISVYPNPFTNFTTLELSDKFISENTECKIYNVMGKMVSIYKIKNRETIIGRGNLSSGIYFYRVLRDEGVIVCGRLILE